MNLTYNIDHASKILPSTARILLWNCFIFVVEEALKETIVSQLNWLGA